MLAPPLDRLRLQVLRCVHLFSLCVCVTELQLKIHLNPLRRTLLALTLVDPDLSFHQWYQSQLRV
jgi:hypothetical protein